MHLWKAAPEIRGGFLFSRTCGGCACCTVMFGMFKKDPVEKLRKEHARLLAEAHRLSTVDRTKSDQMTAKAAEIEAELVALTQKGGA